MGERNAAVGIGNAHNWTGTFVLDGGWPTWMLVQFAALAAREGSVRAAFDLVASASDYYEYLSVRGGDLRSSLTRVPDVGYTRDSTFADAEYMRAYLGPKTQDHERWLDFHYVCTKSTIRMGRHEEHLGSLKHRNLQAVAALLVLDSHARPYDPEVIGELLAVQDEIAALTPAQLDTLSVLLADREAARETTPMSVLVTTARLL